MEGVLLDLAESVRCGEVSVDQVPAWKGCATEELRRLRQREADLQEECTMLEKRYKILLRRIYSHNDDARTTTATKTIEPPPALVSRISQCTTERDFQTLAAEIRNRKRSLTKETLKYYATHLLSDQRPPLE